MKDYYGIVNGGNRGNQYTSGRSAIGTSGITQEELAEQYGYSVDVIKRAESLTKLQQEKINGGIATVMALDRAIRNGGTTGSVYDNRGSLIF